MTIHSFGTRCTRVALALAVICLAPTAHAGDVVFDNGVGGAAGIDNAALSDADTSSLGYSNFCADDVWLASGATITGIEWTGAYYFDNRPPDTDDFTISIYADANGPSGAALFTFNLGDDVNRIDSGTDLALFGGFDVYDFSAAINFVLPANTTYRGINHRQHPRRCRRLLLGRADRRRKLCRFGRHGKHMGEFEYSRHGLPPDRPGPRPRRAGIAGFRGSDHWPTTPHMIHQCTHCRALHRPQYILTDPHPARQHAEGVSIHAASNRWDADLRSSA
jgi:hypothetical protein